MNLTIFLTLLSAGLAALAAWALARRPTTPPAPPLDPLLSMMQNQIEALRGQVSQSLAQNATLLETQLGSVTTNLRSSSGEINQRLDNAAKLYAELRGQLGQLAQTNVQIQTMVKDISSLQDILRPPKLRGGMGEVLLENVMREILPAEHYTTQHRFRSGHIVDCIIRMKEGMVCVDAKFPLENFRRMLEAGTEDERKAARKDFARNVKKHIDDIHSRYILPDEGTFPFALMYIPAENVYYETIIKGDEEGDEKAMYAYAISKQVMPVSPNSFYAYLLTLSQGFRGMKIEERAKEIIGHLNRLRIDLTRFTEEFRKVGIHLGNAQGRFTEAEKRLTRFEDKLTSTVETQQQLPAAESPALELPLEELR